MLFGHDVVAEAGCIGIFAILINTFYLKKARRTCSSVIGGIMYMNSNLIYQS
jgi:hypothetical protein